MTWDQRVQQLQLHGFSDRQAAFILTVLLHAGVCLGRQYCTFMGQAYGQKMHDFFGRLVARGYATARACGHNRARLYHIQYKPLYRAIGQPNSRHRRPMPLARAVERLMVLDAVLADGDRTWLATEQDKLTHFTLRYRVARADVPALTFGTPEAQTTRYFPDRFPIGLDPAGQRHIVTYLVTRNEPIEFRAFLERHAELLRVLPAWTLRLLVPRHKTAAVSAYASAFREQLLTPLRPLVVEDVRWYFRACRQAPQGPDERFDQTARAFGAPRFRALYRAWLRRGDSVLEATVSSVLADAVARGAGRWEPYVLPHNYVRLLPLVGTA